MARPILHPTDFSKPSEAALEYASVLASHLGAELMIVCVSEALPTADDPTPMYHSASGILGAVEAAAESLDALQPTLPGVRCTKKMLHGTPASEILRFAKEHDVGVIVIGSHGHTGLMKLLMGSVAEEITREAECPVIVVKSPSGDPSEEEGAGA